ncbi:F-box/kelch-repeat protein At1g57790 [Ziziphus jujuba]|uniref:F-box/kelch-repeat protein At1g57790 n=1 Tax=Ziziphus jujuba TaxID=326968 RepID=A0ABM3I3X5_ZIZJJ|nr:F-box/kelch-repeat protein At1g57790 [Ziziphus jujuba]
MVVSGEFGSQGVSKICSSMGGWSVLPYDLLVEIAKRLIFEDFVAFSAVCSWWRSSAKKMGFFNSYNPPLLMYFEDQPPTKIVKCYSFSTCKTYKIPCKTYKIPLTKLNPHRVFLSLPWLIIVEQDFHSIFLFNPLNGVQIELPSTSNPRILSEPGRFLASIDKFVLSACPSKTSDYILASIHRYPFGLSFWRPGQTPWNNAKVMMETDNDIASVIFHKGHFYGLDKGGKFFKVFLDMNDMGIKLRVLSVNKEKCKLTHIEDLYLVESAGALLIVSRSASWKPDKICEFRVYEVNIVDGKWTRMMSLGDFSVHALDECKPNCIYFINVTTSSGAIRDEDRHRLCVQFSR